METPKRDAHQEYLDALAWSLWNESNDRSRPARQCWRQAMHWLRMWGIEMREAP